MDGTKTIKFQKDSVNSFTYEFDGQEIVKEIIFAC